MKWHLNHPVHGNLPWAVQDEALTRSDGVPRFGHWMEQGLGKTSTNLNEFINLDDVDINVVIAPNSFKGDWPAAVQEWGIGWLPAGLWPDDPPPIDQEIALYAVNYEAIRNAAYRPLLELLEQRRCMLTIDESKAISNYTTDNFRKVHELAKRAAVVRELNGTPMTQSVMDYYPQLRVLGELNGWNPVAFKRRYAQMGGFMGRQIVGINHEEELATVLDRCTFRALKKDWRKDLPPQIPVPVHLEMTARQRKHFMTMMEEFYAQVSDDDIVTANLVLTQYEKLRQISSCMIMDSGKVHWLEKPENNPKLKALLDVYGNGPGKMIVVHHYRPSGDMLYEQLQRAKLNPARIKGQMKPAEILEQKRMFNTDPTCRVLVGQQDQTSRGHTLVGQAGDRCSRIFFYENSFSLYQRLQMQDRNHRGEQDQTCWLYDPITSLMDQKIVDVLAGRREMADAMDEVVALVRSRQWAR